MTDSNGFIQCALKTAAQGHMDNARESPLPRFVSFRINYNIIGRILIFVTKPDTKTSLFIHPNGFLLSFFNSYNLEADLV